MSKYSLFVTTLVLSVSVFSSVAIAGVGKDLFSSYLTSVDNQSIEHALDLNVSGTWILSADAQGQTLELRLELKQEKKDFKGTVSTPYGDGEVKEGKVEDDQVTAKIDIEIQGSPMILDLKGKVADGKMTGSITGEGIPEVPFEGTKK